MNSIEKNDLDHSNRRGYILQGSFRLDAAAAILECGCLREVGTYRKSNASVKSPFRKHSFYQSSHGVAEFARYKDGEGLPHIARPKVTKPSSRLSSRSRTDVALDAKQLYEQVPAANEDGAND